MIRTQKRYGATAVEVSICLPVLFVLLFGSYEIARTNMLAHAAESAAYEGARIGILPGATVEKVENAVNTILGSIGTRDFNVTVSPTTLDNSTETISVEVSIPMNSNTFFLKHFSSGSQFSGSCRMRRELQ